MRPTWLRSILMLSLSMGTAAHGIGARAFQASGSQIKAQAPKGPVTPP